MKASPAKPRPRRSTCPISFSLDILGDRWTLLIVRDIVFTDKHTFGEFLVSDERIATNILADRLNRLVCAGILHHETAPGGKERGRYDITERGIALVPVLVDLVVWGARHDPQTGAPPEFIEQAVHHREDLLAAIMAGLRGSGPRILAPPSAPVFRPRRRSPRRRPT
jgi:DNA-binding HxlR family transcriptional regulator